MGDSGSFSSLFALVDNHLSKTNVQEENKNNGMNSFRLPMLNAHQKQSENNLTSPYMNFPLPNLDLSNHHLHEESHVNHSDRSNMSVSDRPIQDVLTIQLSNMFKAREAKEVADNKLLNAEKALQKLKLEESNCLIDLTPAVQQSRQVQQHDVETLSSSSSMESLLIPDELPGIEEKAQECEPTLNLLTSPVSPVAVAIQDLNYVIKHKIGKCSGFGKVLCARYRPVAAPYFKTYVPNNNIKVFDFSTPSPDDLILERLKKPSCYGSTNSIMVHE